MADMSDVAAIVFDLSHVEKGIDPLSTLRVCADVHHDTFVHALGDAALAANLASQDIIEAAYEAYCGFVKKKKLEKKCFWETRLGHTGTMIFSGDVTWSCKNGACALVGSADPPSLQPHACANVAQVVFPGGWLSVGFCDVHQKSMKVPISRGSFCSNRFTTPLDNQIGYSWILSSCRRHPPLSKSKHDSQTAACESRLLHVQFGENQCIAEPDSHFGDKTPHVHTLLSEGEMVAGSASKSSKTCTCCQKIPGSPIVKVLVSVMSCLGWRTKSYGSGNEDRLTRSCSCNCMWLVNHRHHPQIWLKTNC